jgi:hypothetical protein
MKDLQQLVGTAAQKVLARKRQYDQVFALVTYWSDDRPYLKEDAGNLWKLFRDSDQ